MTPGDVIRAVRLGLVGEEHSSVWIGQRRFDLVVRLQDHHRSDANAIRALLVDGHDGSRIALGQLAAIEGDGRARRDPARSGQRRIAVEASVAGRDLASAAEEVRTRLAAQLTLPQGYFLDVGGRVESQQRAQRALAVALAVAALAVFVLLYLALGTVIEVLAIASACRWRSSAPCWRSRCRAEPGTSHRSSASADCFGIAVQNGLVLVTQLRSLQAEGRPFADALREACIGRVRPKLITAGTAILGLLPMVVLRLEGTELERPLAIVMIGGLVSSTLFTLLALPAFLELAHRLLERSRNPAR
jgi:cobalt-zinc-cadmium resistance protein CzcA